MGEHTKFGANTRLDTRKDSICLSIYWHLGIIGAEHVLVKYIYIQALCPSLSSSWLLLVTLTTSTKLKTETRVEPTEDESILT